MELVEAISICSSHQKYDYAFHLVVQREYNVSTIYSMLFFILRFSECKREKPPIRRPRQSFTFRWLMAQHFSARKLIKRQDLEMKARKFTLFPIIRQFVCFSCDNNIVRGWAGAHKHVCERRNARQAPANCQAQTVNTKQYYFDAISSVEWSRVSWRRYQVGMCTHSHISTVQIHASVHT